MAAMNFVVGFILAPSPWSWLLPPLPSFLSPSLSLSALFECSAIPLHQPVYLSGSSHTACLNVSVPCRAAIVTGYSPLFSVFWVDAADSSEPLEVVMCGPEPRAAQNPGSVFSWLMALADLHC